MRNDYLEIENAEGMADLTDSAIALEFLLSAKNGVRNYAIALTEAITPAVKSTLRKQLNTAIDLHEDISQLMIDKGWLHPYDPSLQLKLDFKSTQMALQIANLDLFPGDTSRLGTFATPFK